MDTQEIGAGDVGGSWRDRVEWLLAYLQGHVSKKSILLDQGIAVLGVGGAALVPNALVGATTIIILTAQDGGPAATGSPFNSGRAPGVSFGITSTAGAGDAGVNVAWQLWRNP